MILRLTSLIAPAMTLLVLSGCMSSPTEISRDRTSPPALQTGLGAAQTIKEGDSKESVLEKLGSPEIITSAEGGGELWVYDKLSVSTETEKGATGLFSSATVTKSSKKTMMTTVYFDNSDQVTNIKYRASRY